MFHKLIKKIPIVNRFDRLFWGYLFISVIATANYKITFKKNNSI